MNGSPQRSLLDRPRVLVAGRPRAASAAAVAREFGRLIEGDRVDAGGLLGIRTLARTGARRARDGECEAVHAFEARLAPAAADLRRRFGVVATATVGERDLRGRVTAQLRALGQLDAVFVDDDALAARLAADCAVVIVPPVVEDAPPAQRSKAIRRTLADVPPGRLVLGMPWPRERGVLRWYRDAVVPLLSGAPVTLLLGAPGRREAATIVGTPAARRAFRACGGRLDDAMLAAAAPYVDAFVVPGAARDEGPATELTCRLLRLDVPVIADAGVARPVIEHERSGIVVERGDGMALVGAVNGLLALPAVQRHYLGQDFAAHARARWSARAAAEAYVERLSALVGRPRIPLALRAAA